MSLTHFKTMLPFQANVFRKVKKESIGPQLVKVCIKISNIIIINMTSAAALRSLLGTINNYKTSNIINIMKLQMY